MNKLLLSLPLFVLIFSVTPQVFAEYEDTIVVLETNSGRLIMEFFPDVAPNHVENFITLSESGFYTNTVFHRIIEGFMIQGGDPNSKDMNLKAEWGRGSPGYTIDSEFNNIEHKRGIVSMARSNDPNSAGSQFFIVHKDSNFLDNQYTVFGRILTDESFETLDKIANIDTAPNDQPLNPSQVTLNSVQILNRSELDNLPDFILPDVVDSDALLDAPTTSVRNDFPQFGISFTSPAGWLVQTPDPFSSSSPDIVIVGPKLSNSNPAISITITRDISSLEKNIEILRNTVTPLIEAGALSIVSEFGTQILDNNAYVFNAIGHFENRDGIEKKVGFSTILLKANDDMLYTFQYSNDLESYDDYSKQFGDVMDSIEFTSMEFTKISSGEEPDEIGYDGTLDNQSEGGGCLIATASYGSEMAPQVQFLREIRDSKVMTTQSGTTFMTGFNQFYYSFSPTIADYQRENPVFKEAVKVTITPLLTSLTLLNYIDLDSEHEILGYGIGIILLNIGMYFVAPAAAIITIKNRIK